MNDHDAEDEAGEHSEESSNACNTHKFKQVREVYMKLTLKTSLENIGV